MDSLGAKYSYTPELSSYLAQHLYAWQRVHDKVPVGVVGTFMGDCEPAHHRRDPVYHNITVRDALNLMSIRSLQVSNGQAASTEPASFKRKAISWKYRFRPEPEAETGLGGVPLFQTF